MLFRSGSIKTQYFGDKYDPDKIDRKLLYGIWIYPPAHVVNNPNFTLTLMIEKLSMTVSGDSKDIIRVGEVEYPDQNFVVQNFTAPNDYINIVLKRDVTPDEIKFNPLVGLKKNPGFTIKWGYSEYDALESDSQYKDIVLNIVFRR